MTTPDQDSFNTSADNDQEAAPLDEKSATGGDLAQQPAGTTVSSGEPEQLIAEQDQTPHIFGDELASDKAIVAAGDAASFNGLDHTDQNTDAPQDISAESLLELWQPRLQTWAEQGELLDAATVALHLDQNQPPPPQLTGIVERLKQGHTTDIPTIELLEQAAIPSAAGAYAASKRTIYLNRNWVNTASETDTVRVLTEEFGHHLDALIQTVDTPGDEGRQLSDLLTGNNGTDGQNHHNQLKSQGQIEIDGELIDVEFSTLNNSLEWIQVGDEINGVARSERAGWAVSLSEDGTILAVGSPYDDMGSDFNANHGSVKIYQDVNGAWQQLGSEIEGTSIKGIRGHSVRLSNDGTRVAVVTRFGDSGSLTNCGRVNIYQFTNGDWSQLDNSILGAHNNGRIDDAALSGDGNYVILGSANKYSGYAEVYQHNSTSNAWEQVGSRLTGVKTPDRFGYAVDISDDGNIIAVGSYGFDNNGVVNTGAVRVYEFTNGDWSEIDEIVGDKKTDQLGFSVSLSSDGTYVAAGARCHDVGNNQTSNEGYARVYQRNGSTYSQIGETLVGEQVEGRVGTKVSLSSDGLRLAVGAGQHDFPGKTNAGQVKLYELQSGTWNQIGSEINGENQTDVAAKWHGLSLNGDGTRVAIGAHNNDNSLRNSGQVRIFDSSGITIAQASTPLVTTEAGSTASFTVVLDAKPTDNVTVSITGDDSTEHQLSASSLTFTTSNWNTAQTVTVTGVDDNLDDGDITTTLTATASNTGGYAGTETATATLQTSDDDSSGITIAQASTPLVTTEAGSTASFTVVLDAKPTDNVTVSITGDDSTEHQLSASSLTFTTSNWNTAQTVTVTGVDDNLDDGDITTTLTATASNTGGYAGTETATTTVKNTDDDSSGITIAQASTPLVTTEAGSTASFTVVLDAKPTDNVTVSITGDDSTEHQLSASSLTFTTSNWNTAQTVTVTGVDDSIVDGDITTTLTATASNTGGYAGTETATATLQTSDDDSSGITIAQASTPLVTTEAGSTASFTVVLDAKPTDNVTVSITGDDSTEHQLSASSLTFTTSNWNTAQTITVTGVDDNLDDGDITTTLTATASNTGGYAGTETATATLQTSDDDSSGITIAQASTPLVTTEAGSTASFTVVLDAKPTDNVTVSITGDDSTEHQLSASSLTFTTSNWNTAQTITVTGVDDNLDDGDITTTLTATASNTGGYAGTETATATLQTSDDDSSGITIAQASTPLVTTEAGSTASFTVVLDAKPTDSVTVSITGDDSTEHQLSASSLTFTTSNWNTAQTVTVTGVDDNLDDGDITTTLTATASNTGGYAGTETATATLQTSDDDSSGITITQASTPLVTTEAGSTASFTVVLDNEPTDSVTVSITGDDSTEHQLSASSLTFTTSNWNTAQTITVTGIDDNLDDGDITTTLTATASNTGGYAGTETATTTVKNTDDDSSGITIAQASTPLVTTEAGSTASFTVVLDAKPTDSVTVSITGDDSTEHQLSTSSLTFTTSNWNTAQTVTVTGVDDNLDDGDITTTLTATASNTGGYAGTETATATLQTSDDDSSGITIAQASTPLVTTEAGSTASFTVVLDAKPTDNVTVSITGDDSTEHQLSASSLTFTTSNWNTAQTITVTGVDDNLDDGDITTTLTATASNTGGYAGTETATATLQTSDDDSSGITIAQASTPLVTTEAGSTASFTVVLDAKPTDSVTVSITGDDSTEHQLSASSLTFTTSNWNTAQTITVTGVDDNLDDGDITTTLTATASNTGGYAGTETATATLQTSDDDSSGITIAQASTPLVTTEAGSTASFTVVLDAKPTDSVTVSITGDDSTEHQLSASSLTFTTSNWNTAQTVTVTGVDDSIVDGDITTTLTATASNTGGYAGTETATATLQTSDDDTAGITIAQASTPLVTTEAGSTASFTVVLDNEPTDNVTVSITGDDSTEHQLSASSLTFTTSNWNTAQTVTVTGVDDSSVDGDITTTLTATASNTGGYAGTETATATVKTTDNDNPPAITDQSKSELETLADGSEILDLADSNTGNDTDQDGDAISYSITNGNSSNLFTIDKTTGKILLATGQSLDHDTSDLHTLEITASSTGGSTTATVEINVLDVNNTPVAADDSGSLNENETLSKAEAEGLIINDSDEDVDDILTISSFHVGFSDTDSPRYGQFNTALDGIYGQLTLQTDGSYTYAANKASSDALSTGESGTDTFSYTLSDSEETDQAELTITIAGVNDNPYLVDAIKTKKYIEGQGNVIVIDGSLDIRDVDDANIESATVSISDSTYVSTEDQLAFSDAYGITGNWNSSTGVLTLSGTTTKANYVNALQTVTYTNTNNADPIIGARTIDWLVNDGDSNSASIQSSIIVGGRNDAPLAVNNSAGVDGGSTVSTSTADNLLANDTDPETHSLSITSFRLGSEQSTSPEFLVGNTLTGTYGQMTIEADGTYSYSAQESAAYKLLDGETAIETFTYTITDSQTIDEGIDTGEISVTINGINDAPTAIDDAVEVDEDSSKQFEDFLGILKNDTDVDGDQLFIKGVRTGGTTSSLRANSLESSSLNTELQGTYGVLVVNSNGSFRYTASLADALDEGDKEVDRFTYTLTDLTNDDSAEMEIEVTGINDAPVLSSITAGSITDQTNSSTLQTSNITGQLSATDADASAVLTYGISGVSGSTTSGTYGTLTLNSTTGIYQYLPKNTVIEALNAGESVSDSFEIYVTDGSQLATRTFQINIIGANDVSNEASNNNSNTESNNSNVVTTDQNYGLTIVASGVINDAGHLVTTEDGVSSSFTVVLNREPDDDVNVSISGLDSTEGRLNTDTLRFTPSNWNIPQTVTVTGINDLLSDGTATYNLTATANKAGGYSGSEAATITISNIDQSDPQQSELIVNSDGQGFNVTGDTGLWVQLEVLQANADLHNSLQIIDDQGEAIGSIGATRNSTNMGKHEIFISGGSEWFFHQLSHDSKLNKSPSLRIHSGLDDFILHLDDSKNGDNDHDDLSIKITTSERAQNPVAAELASQQKNIYEPILNLSKISTPAATLRMTIESDCADTSRLGLVKLTGDENKGFTVNGITSEAGESFDQAVRDNLINPGNTELLVGGLTTSEAEWSLDQSQEGFYAPVFINKNSNDLFTFGATSARDNQIHVKNLGSNFFGYEDRLSSQNSDWDFNDITVKVELL